MATWHCMYFSGTLCMMSLSQFYGRIYFLADFNFKVLFSVLYSALGVLNFHQLLMIVYALKFIVLHAEFFVYSQPTKRTNPRVLNNIFVMHIVLHEFLVYSQPKNQHPNLRLLNDIFVMYIQ